MEERSRPPGGVRENPDPKRSRIAVGRGREPAPCSATTGRDRL